MHVLHLVLMSFFYDCRVSCFLHLSDYFLIKFNLSSVLWISCKLAIISRGLIRFRFRFWCRNTPQMALCTSSCIMSYHVWLPYLQWYKMNWWGQTGAIISSQLWYRDFGHLRTVHRFLPFLPAAQGKAPPLLFPIHRSHWGFLKLISQVAGAGDGFCSFNCRWGSIPYLAVTYLSWSGLCENGRVTVERVPAPVMSHPALPCPTGPCPLRK